MTNDEAWRSRKLKEHFDSVCADLIGPESNYSKIGRDRRVALREKISLLLQDAYKDGVGMGARTMDGI